jgi:hypothetical protein
MQKFFKFITWRLCTAQHVSVRSYAHHQELNNVYNFDCNGENQLKKSERRVGGGLEGEGLWIWKAVFILIERHEMLLVSSNLWHINT